MPFDMLALLSLPAIIFIGAVTSYEDIKYGRIRNKWVVCSLAYSLVAMLAVVVYLYAQNEPISKEYLLRFFINISFAALAGFLIWISGMWSAGDAKLFIAYAALVPLSLYYNSSSTYFPSFAILIYTFLPLFAFYVLRIFFKTSIKQKLSVLKEALKPQRLLENVLFLFAFTWLIYSFLEYFAIFFIGTNKVFVVVFFLFVLAFFFQNVLKANLLKISMILSATALLLGYRSILTLQFLEKFAFIFFLFYFIRYFILNLSFEALSYPVYIEDLKPGMVPAENYFGRKRRYIKTRNVPLSFLSALLSSSRDDYLIKSGSEGLQKREVNRIKKLHAGGLISEHRVRVFQTVAFAPFLFIGVLLMVFGNLF